MEGDCLPRRRQFSPEQDARESRTEHTRDVTYHEPSAMNSQLLALKIEMEAMHRQLNHSLDPPLVVNSLKLFYNFKPLTYEYDGTSDPYDHLLWKFRLHLQK